MRFQLPLEPVPPSTPEARRKRKLLMPVQTGITPRSRIAEALARVSAPPGRSATAIASGKLCFAPLRAPSQLSSYASLDFSRQNPLPFPSYRVRKPHPHEMKYLVDQNALKFARRSQNFTIERDHAARNGGSGQMRTQRRANLDAYWTPFQRRKHARSYGFAVAPGAVAF